jgi:mannitol-1-/sugar-/sorbitol-6-/2-deoxyglucose-6-phosphatase
MPTGLRAVVFDMDGLLIDTEPIWRQTEMRIFGDLGVHLTEEQCLESMGMRVPDVVRRWYGRHPWTGSSIEDVTNELIQAVIDYVRREGEPREGVIEAFNNVRDEGLPIAIASSSSVELIGAVVERLGLGVYISALCSADDEAAGKPDPAVYLTAARRLGVAPEQCLALEDSPNGVVSAKRAGMVCIAVPDRLLADDPRFDTADMSLDSLLQVTPRLLREIGEGMAAPGW